MQENGRRARRAENQEKRGDRESGSKNQTAARVEEFGCATITIVGNEH